MLLLLVEKHIITATILLDIFTPFHCLTKLMSRNDPTGVCCMSLLLYCQELAKRCLGNMKCVF